MQECNLDLRRSYKAYCTVHSNMSTAPYTSRDVSNCTTILYADAAGCIAAGWSMDRTVRLTIKNLANRNWTSDRWIYVCTLCTESYSPPLYQLSYREMKTSAEPAIQTHHYHDTPTPNPCRLSSLVRCTIHNPLCPVMSMQSTYIQLIRIMALVTWHIFIGPW
jgi:hypothetical protein